MGMLSLNFAQLGYKGRSETFITTYMKSNDNNRGGN